MRTHRQILASLFAVVGLLSAVPLPAAADSQPFNCVTNSGMEQMLLITLQDGSQYSFEMPAGEGVWHTFTVPSDVLPANLQAFHRGAWFGYYYWTESMNNVTGSASLMHLDSEDWIDNDWNDLQCDYDACTNGIEAPWGPGALLLYSGATRRVNSAGYNICAANNSGSHYFIPGATGDELQHFINAAARLGVSIF